MNFSVFLKVNISLTTANSFWRLKSIAVVQIESKGLIVVETC